jgi:ATPase family AAA domain-containing protein 3A/B
MEIIVMSLQATNLYATVTGGFRMILTDRSKLVMAVGGVTALADGVYTTRFL